MDYNSNSKLTDILSQHPWLPDELVKIDGRFKIVKTPIGKMMIKNATVSDLSKKTGIPEKILLDKLDELINEHEKQ
ncbi:MAG: hypothetical protein UFA98_02195 [Ruminococcus sp.]|nr:hypothetical protein [Ruminococcus sp.]